MRCLRNKAHDLGANFVVGTVEGFNCFNQLMQTVFNDRPKRPPLVSPYLSEVLIKTPAGDVEKITFNTAVNCAGAWSSEIMKMAMATAQKNILPLPVEKRYKAPFHYSGLFLIIYEYSIELAFCSHHRKHNIFVVRPDYSQSSMRFPGIDSPIILDSSGLLVQRQGLSGDFAVCLNPTLPREAKSVCKPFEFTSSFVTIT